MDIDELLVINQVFNDLVEAEEHLENQMDDAPRFHARLSAFNTLTNEQFIKNFRLTKDLTRHVIQLITPYVAQPSRQSAITVETKVLVAFHFYGHGSYQEGVGKHLFAAVSQSSVSRCIHEVTDALNRIEIMQRYIHFPENVQELEQLRLRFFRKYQFPGIVGCVDGTHVAIIRPNEHEEIYVNRKNYHSLNVQLVCDENLKIMSTVARFPGSSHDSHVWRQSRVSQVMENIYRNVHQPFFLLGDSGYPLRPWLLTPLEDAVPGTPEWRFNEAFKSIRSIIERCNGTLKNRFRCLLRHRVLHYDPAVAGQIINACAILHNICIENNVPEPDNDDVVDHDFGVYAPVINPFQNDPDAPAINPLQNDPINRMIPDLAAGRQLRHRIIINNFA